MRCARSTTRCCRPNWRVSQPPGRGHWKGRGRRRRDIIRQAGYGPCFGTASATGVGVEITRGPTPTPSNDKPLPAGAVISAEPGIYLPGKLGVRIEDVLYLTPEGLSKPHSGPQGAGHSLTPIQSHARRKNPMASYIGASAEQEDADPILMAFGR